MQSTIRFPRLFVSKKDKLVPLSYNLLRFTRDFVQRVEMRTLSAENIKRLENVLVSISEIFV